MIYSKTGSKAHMAFLSMGYGASISRAQKLTGLSLRRLKVIKKSLGWKTLSQSKIQKIIKCLTQDPPASKI